MAKQFSANPTRKVAGGAVAGAATTLFVWWLKSDLSVDVPADAARANADLGLQTSVPADGTLIGFEASLEARADYGMQALVYTNRLIAGDAPAIR